MVLYEYDTSSTSMTNTAKPQDMDNLLAYAGYKVRSSELRHVAQCLERLETAMLNSNQISLLASDAVLYNPSDLSSWVDSLLTELPSLPSDLSDLNPTAHVDIHPTAPDHLLQTQNPNQNNNQVMLLTALEEDSGIKLVHALLTCAETIQRGDFSLAGSIVDEMQTLLSRINTTCGIGKVAGHFIEALTHRIYSPATVASAAVAFHEILYHNFYEASPYLKFAHFTANQAILEAFDGCDVIHVVDFNLMHGLQWPALIQALALRTGGPPFLRLTGIGPPSSDGRDGLREIGLKLADLARSVNVGFSFRGVAASRLDDVKPWMLQVNAAETLAFNSVFQLHKLLIPGSPIDPVLSWIFSLNPKIVTVIEQEADHNQETFIDRFTEALYYYSTIFDSLEASSCSSAQPEKFLAEMYVQREIWNVVGCEGSCRVERHEPLWKWRERMGLAGFKPIHLGSNAFKQASMLLTLFSAEGYCVEESEGCLTLGWHSRPLISASAWQAAAVDIND